MYRAINQLERLQLRRQGECATLHHMTGNPIKEPKIPKLQPNWKKPLCFILAIS